MLDHGLFGGTRRITVVPREKLEAVLESRSPPFANVRDLAESRVQSTAWVGFGSRLIILIFCFGGPSKMDSVSWLI